MSSCKTGVRELQNGKERGMEEEGKRGRGKMGETEGRREKGETISYSKDEQRKGLSRVACVSWL